MNMMRKLAAAALLFAIAGCSQMQTATRGPEHPEQRVVLTPELRQLYRDAAAGTGKLEAVDGYADLYLKTPKRKAKAYCTVQVQKSHDARLIVTAGLLGWPVADMLIRPDSLFVHDMLNNRMLVGRNSSKNLEKILGVDAGFGQLTETLFGMAAMTDPESSIESVHQGAGKVSYTIRQQGGRKVLLVDQASKSLQGMTMLDVFGRKKVEFLFSGYQSEPAGNARISVPREIDMNLYRQGEPDSSNSLRVVYDERVINPPDLKIRFKRAPKARVISLDEVERMPWL